MDCTNSVREDIHLLGMWPNSVVYLHPIFLIFSSSRRISSRSYGEVLQRNSCSRWSFEWYCFPGYECFALSFCDILTIKLI
jgi:hypothetical protein